MSQQIENARIAGSPGKFIGTLSTQVDENENYTTKKGNRQTKRMRRKRLRASRNGPGSQGAQRKISRTPVIWIGEETPMRRPRLRAAQDHGDAGFQRPGDRDRNAGEPKPHFFTRYRSRLRSFPDRRTVEPRILDPESLTSGVLGNHDVRELRSHVLGGLGDLDREPARDRPVDLRRPAVGIGDHGRLARVGVLADIDVERQGPEQLGAVLPAHALGAALPEDVLLVTAVRADVRAHVLDDAEDGNADFLEHLEALAGV